MYKEFLETEHRPYRMPHRPWILTQVWRDILFMHWPVPEQFMRPFIPEALELDTYDGSAWLSIIHLRITNMRGRGLPLIPFMNSYLELNVRTYVVRDGIPGIYFFSLDANHLPTVAGAGIFTGLPYKLASMDYKKKKGKSCFSSRRRKTKEEFHVIYHPEDLLFEAEPGTLDHWLLERYCMYSFVGKSLFRGDIHHDKWKVRRGKADITSNTLAPFLPNSVFNQKPIIHFAKRRRFMFFPLKKVK